MKNKKSDVQDELLPEYNFNYTNAVRGKYYKKLMEEGSNIVVLEPDIADVFHDSESVNKALRSLLEITQATRRLTTHPSDAEKLG